jgi:hypothetical protein
VTRRRLIAVGAMAIAYIVVVAAVVWTWDWNGWAALARWDWTGIGTMGAFTVALFLFGVQIWDRRAEAHERRMVQARLVSTWLGNVLKERDVQPILVILVCNGSAEPVYGVAMQVEVGVRGTFVRDLGVLGPGETRELQIEVPGYLKSMPRPDIAFKDSAGRKWVRRGTGEILEGDPNPAFQLDPGAYMSIEKHPTLGVDKPWEERRGTKVP